MTVTWRDHFATGIESVDDQHRELFARLDRFLNAVDAGNGAAELLPTLDFLLNYAASHFSVEEHLMETHDYPHIGLQVNEHLRFMDNMERLRGKIADGATTQELALLAGRILKQWLVHHVCELDWQFGEFLRDRFAQPQPVQR